MTPETSPYFNPDTGSYTEIFPFGYRPSILSQKDLNIHKFQGDDGMTTLFYIAVLNSRGIVDSRKSFESFLIYYPKNERDTTLIIIQDDMDNEHTVVHINSLEDVLS